MVKRASKLRSVTGGFNELHVINGQKARVEVMKQTHREKNAKKKTKVAHFRETCDMTESLLLRLGLKFEVVRDIDIATIDVEDTTYQTRPERVLENSVDEYGQLLSEGKVFRPCVFSVDLADRHNIKAARKRVVAGFTRTQGAKDYGCTRLDFAYVVVAESAADIERLKDFSGIDNVENSGEKRSERDHLRNIAVRVRVFLAAEQVLHPSAKELASRVKAWGSASRLSLTPRQVDSVIDLVKREYVLSDIETECKGLRFPEAGSQGVLDSLYKFRRKNGYSKLLDVVRRAAVSGVANIKKLLDSSYARGDDCEAATKAVEAAASGLSSASSIPMPSAAIAQMAVNDALKKLHKAIEDPMSETARLEKLRETVAEFRDCILPELDEKIKRSLGVAACS